MSKPMTSLRLESLHAVGMNITPAVKEAHEALSPCNIAFLDYAKKNPLCLQRSQFEEIVKWKHPASATKENLQPWPIFIGRRTRNEFEEASAKVFNLIKSVHRRLFSNDPTRISRYYALSEDFVQFCLDGISEEHMNGLVGRGDFLITPSGLKCIEFNASSSLGGWELPVWEPMYLRNPLISEFVKSHRIKIINKNLLYILFEHLIDSTLKWFPGEDEINIVISVYSREILAATSTLEEQFSRQFMNALQFNNKTKRLKGKLIFSCFDQLNVANRTLYYGDKRIHTLLHGYTGDIPFDILTLFKLKNLLIYNGPVFRIVSNKFNLSVLSEHEDSDLFTAEERKTIKKYFPWTRKVIDGAATYRGEKINLENFILGNKDKLVLKPSIGYGGTDVYNGLYTPQSQWRALVSQALRQERWVVQERIESQPFLFQWGENGCAEFEAAWGMMTFGYRYGGVLLRILTREKSKGVINVHQGAEVPVVFEVEE